MTLNSRFLPPHVTCWDYRHLPHLVSMVLGIALLTPGKQSINWASPITGHWMQAQTLQMYQASSSLNSRILAMGPTTIPWSCKSFMTSPKYNFLKEALPSHQMLGSHTSAPITTELVFWGTYDWRQVFKEYSVLGRHLFQWCFLHVFLLPYPPGC